MPEVTHLTENNEINYLPMSKLQLFYVIKKATYRFDQGAQYIQWNRDTIWEYFVLLYLNYSYVFDSCDRLTHYLSYNLRRIELPNFVDLFFTTWLTMHITIYSPYIRLPIHIFYFIKKCMHSDKILRDTVSRNIGHVCGKSIHWAHSPPRGSVLRRQKWWVSKSVSLR